MKISIKHLAGVTGVGAALILGGCNTVHTVDTTIYNPDYVGYAARNGAMPLEIIGNPFGPTDADDIRLTDALSLPGWHGTQKFERAQRKDDKWTNARVVLYFDAADKLTDGQDLCDGATGPLNRNSDLINVRAAFCAGDKKVSSAIGEGTRPQTPNDPEFQSLMHTVLAAMLPRINPNRGHDCQTVNCNP